MTFGFRATAVAGIALAIAGYSFGQTSDYRALVTYGGQVKLLFNSQSVMNLRFGLFRDGWKELHTNAMGLQPDGSYMEAGDLQPGTMTVKTFYQLIGSTARLTVHATPSRTLSADSSHMNLRFDPGFWGGGTFTAGNWSAAFPRTLAQTIYKSGTTDRFTARTTGGLEMTVKTPTAAHFSFRDSRRYNVGFELRFQETWGTWNAGVTKTFVVDITPNQPMPIGPDSPVTITQGPDWIPLDHKIHVTPGSALDWSRPNPEYAGSKGWLKVSPNGDFYFENDPNTKVKFYGANLVSYGCFLSKSESDALAADLHRRGYNAVRLHHTDWLVIAPEAPNSTTISPYWADRLMYLIEAMKKKGIYVSLDLYSLRETRPNEVMPGSSLTYAEYKAGLLMNNAVRQNFLTYSSNLLNTYNPYSGKKLKDDPGIAWISLANENNPLWLNASNVRPDILNALSTAVGAPWDVLTDEGARRADTLLTAEWEYLKTQVRGMGVKALLSMVNGGDQTAISRTRARLDYVDAHFYYGNPEWHGQRGQVPYSQDCVPPIAKIIEFGRTSQNHIHNKAYVVSEFDGSAPNPYRAEMGLMWGTLAAVQQWDAIFRFNFADQHQRVATLNRIELNSAITDPSTLAGERLIINLFLREDLKNTEAPTVVHVPFATAGLSELKHVPLIKNGALKVPIAISHSTGDPNPETPVLDGVSVGSNGQVVADLYQQSLRVGTPRTCGVFGTPGVPLTAGRMTADIQGARASVWATSLDGLELGSSRRILLAHITEVQNTGTTWADTERSTVTNTGTLPHLARVGSATINITGIRQSTARVFRLDISGKRVGTVPVTKGSGGGIKFDISTRNPADGKATIFYEITQ